MNSKDETDLEHLIRTRDTSGLSDLLDVRTTLFDSNFKNSDQSLLNTPFYSPNIKHRVFALHLSTDAKIVDLLLSKGARPYAIQEYIHAKNSTIAQSSRSFLGKHMWDPVNLLTNRKNRIKLPILRALLGFAFYDSN